MKSSLFLLFSSSLVVLSLAAPQYPAAQPSSIGGSAQVQCRKQQTGPGQYKFVCDGASPEQITLRSEHILWLTSEGGEAKIVDIEVPNYKIEELIKAGYKTAPGGDTKINVLLRRPEQTAEAEVDVPKGDAGDTSVNVVYEPVSKQLIHFPNDKQYTPLRGPILPPLNPGAATNPTSSGRFQRGVVAPKHLRL